MRLTRADAQQYAASYFASLKATKHRGHMVTMEWHSKSTTTDIYGITKGKGKHASVAFYLSKIMWQQAKGVWEEHAGCQLQHQSLTYP